MKGILFIGGYADGEFRTVDETQFYRVYKRHKDGLKYHNYERMQLSGSGYYQVVMRWMEIPEHEVIDLLLNSYIK